MNKKKALKVVVIGAGMSGILAAIRLREKGDDVVVLEKADKLGGTWRDNRYAGLTCDVPAHAYTYSFAPYPEWSRYFAPGPEIFHYFETVAHDYGVYDAICFGEEVLDVSWKDRGWSILTKSGASYRADVVIAATGVLHHPRFPEIEGLEKFTGQSFHSAQWPEEVDFAGKRVAVVGNGSTGVQIVSALAGVAAHVDHFQRSPQWIMPVQDFAYSNEDRARFRSDPAAIDAIRFDEQYVSNVRRFNNAIVDPSSEAMATIEIIVRDHLETAVADADLRERLRPDYRAACKRLIYSPDYYQKVQHPDVDVVVEGIRNIEASGVRTNDDALHPCDILILATGFQADRFVRPIKVSGRDGLTIDDAWTKGPSAFLAVSIPDFPNFFLLNGPTGPVGNFSLIDIAEAQWGYLEQLLDLLRCGKADEVSASRDAMADYDEQRVAAARTTIFASGCSSWYLNADGVPQSWPWGYDRFFEAMRTPDLAAFDIRLVAQTN